MVAMKEINIVLPIKDPAQAKERLASLLSPDQRRELAAMLIEQTMQFFVAFLDEVTVLVVTDSEVVARQAATNGFAVLREERAEGETAAVEKATAWSVAQGFRTQIVIPGDMAGLDANDIRRLISMPRPHPSLILCPATGDDGTNAIMSTPPDVVAFRFGERSFPDYRARAAAQDVPCQIVRLPSLVLDLDTPEDVVTFLQSETASPIKETLRSWMNQQA